MAALAAGAVAAGVVDAAVEVEAGIVEDFERTTFPSAGCFVPSSPCRPYRFCRRRQGSSDSVSSYCRTSCSKTTTQQQCCCYCDSCTPDRPRPSSDQTFHHVDDALPPATTTRLARVMRTLSRCADDGGAMVNWTTTTTTELASAVGSLRRRDAAWEIAHRRERFCVAT